MGSANIAVQRKRTVEARPGQPGGACVQPPPTRAFRPAICLSARPDRLRHS
jgi:hypothetical protein